MSTKSNPRISVMQQQAADQALIDGFTKHQATLPPSFLIAGVHVPTTTIVATLQARIAARAAVATARASYQAVVKASHDQLDTSQARISGAREAVKVMFAGQVEALADFGLSPRKARAPRTPQQNAASIAKAQATREARHTMGPKAKRRVTGENSRGR
jgi:hypothetical protein